jgi:hypothetical protein
MNSPSSILAISKTKKNKHQRCQVDFTCSNRYLIYKGAVYWGAEISMVSIMRLDSVVSGKTRSSESEGKD